MCLVSVLMSNLNMPPRKLRTDLKCCSTFKWTYNINFKYPKKDNNSTATRLFASACCVKQCINQITTYYFRCVKYLLEELPFDGTISAESCRSCDGCVNCDTESNVQKLVLV